MKMKFKKLFAFSLALAMVFQYAPALAAYNTGTGSAVDTSYNTGSGTQNTTYNTGSGSSVTDSSYNVGSGSAVSSSYNTGSGSAVQDDSTYNTGSGSAVTTTYNTGAGSAVNSDYNTGTGTEVTTNYNTGSGSAVTTTYNTGTGTAIYACNDGIDNDGDGLVDLNDPGCVSSTDTSEQNVVVQNNPPIWNQVSNRTVNVGQGLNINVSAFDPDGDALTYSSVTLPANSSFNATTRLFSFTPSSGQAGNTYQVTLRVSDGVNSPVQMSFTVFVNQNQQPPFDDNDAPLCTFVNSRTVDVNDTVSFFVNAFDPDGDNLTFSVSDRPSNSSLNSSTGFFSFSPSRSQEGNTYFLQFTARDPEGLSCTTSAQIRVFEDDDDDDFDFDDDDLEWPFFSTQRLDVGENFDRTFRVRDHNSRVDYDASNLPSGADYDDNGRFEWRPRSNQEGTWFITFRAERDGDRATRTVRFEVGDDDFDDDDDFNRRPVFISSPQTAAVVNRVYQYDANAFDQDGDTLRYSLARAPSGASIDQNTGFVTWVPTLSDAGRSFQFTVQVTDRRTSPVDQSFTVFVQPQGQVLGTSDTPGFPNTGAGGSAMNRMLLPLSLVAALSALGLFLLRRMNASRVR